MHSRKDSKNSPGSDSDFLAELFRLAHGKTDTSEESSTSICANPSPAEELDSILSGLSSTAKNPIGSATSPLGASDSTISADFSDILSPSLVIQQHKSTPEADNLVKGLNPQQKQAVEHRGTPILVIAGAGSGKTRVLTHRIAHLIATGEALPSEIIAITFTNKAAKEMQERLHSLLGSSSKSMWVSTFHSACVKILRMENELAGLKPNFTIYDSTDSQRLMKLVTQELKMSIDKDREISEIKKICSQVSKLKNELVPPPDSRDSSGFDLDPELGRVYALYSKKLKDSNALDFDDIIFRTVMLLKQHPQLAKQYSKRFKYILIDEYQDTNHAQYVLVKELSKEFPAGLTVVGDSDQSIYAFRGATIRNILQFEKDFPGAATVILEQNYRSTQNILSAANAVISKNPGRQAKNLWTDNGTGSIIKGFVAENEYDEARFVSRTISKMHSLSSITSTDTSYSYKDFAIFYRANAQSRALEESLVRANIPYIVVGGTKFYDHKEVKDILAYLKAANNPADTVSLRRILNVPKRGIGNKTEQVLVDHARQWSVDFGQAIADAAQTFIHSEDQTTYHRPVLGITARALKSLYSFNQILEKMRIYDLEGRPVSQIVDVAIEDTGYLPELQGSKDVQDRTRSENLQQLKSKAVKAQKDYETALVDTYTSNPSKTLTDVELSDEKATEDLTYRLSDFLEEVALVSDSDQLQDKDQTDGQVTLMTVHTAKGLEFDNVFVTGLEEGTFPHRRAISDSDEIEEERRMAYVAITRARKNLFLSRCEYRRLWDSSQFFIPSQFLEDIPPSLVEWEYSPNISDAQESYWSSSPYRRESWQSQNSHWADEYRQDSWSDESSYHSHNSGGYGRHAGRFSNSTRTAYSRRKPIDQKTRITARDNVEEILERVSSRAKPTTKIGGTERIDGSEKKIPTTSGQAQVDLSQFEVGQQVFHDTFGTGTIIGFDGAGRSLALKIKFKKEGVKRILARTSSLKPLNND